MAVSFVAQTSAAASSVSLSGSLLANDLILIFAWRNTTTQPSLPTGYTNIFSQSANGVSFRCGYKIAVGGDTSGTWTNADGIMASIYRGASGVGGAGSNTNASAASTTVPGIGTFTKTDATSLAVSFGMSLQTTSMSTPAGTTLRGTPQTGISDMALSFDSGSGVSSWAQHLSTNGVSAAGGGGSVELLAGSIPLIQSSSGVNTLAALTVAATFASNTRTGNLVVVGVGYYDGFVTGPLITGITDSQGNTYQKAVVGVRLSPTRVEIWYAMNITGGTTPTVTVTSSANAKAAMFIREYSGAATTAALDVTLGGSSSTGNTATVGPTSSTTSANELVISVVATGNTTSVITAGTSYSNSQTATGGSSAPQAVSGMEDMNVISTATQTATFNITGVNPGYSIAIATFTVPGSTPTITNPTTAMPYLPPFFS